MIYYSKVIKILNTCFKYNNKRTFYMKCFFINKLEFYMILNHLIRFN